MKSRIWVLVMLIVTLGLVACAPVADGPAAEGDMAGEDAAEPVEMTFWMNLNFQESVNDLIREQVQEWADLNNVDIDILISPDADLQPKWSAGLEAPETLPDV